jgi:hypothetical protein
MPFTPFNWQDRPSALDPLGGETPAQWLTRINAYAAAHPGALTPVDAAALVDLETRLSAYTDDEVGPVASDLSTLSASVSAALADKAPLASPALTGNPTAPTQAPGDDSDKLATTAYADAAVAAGGGGGGGGGSGVTPLSWTPLSLGTGWADGTSGRQTQPAAWAKDDYGIVHLRGLIQAGNPVVQTTLFTLPAGARPPVISGGMGFAKIMAALIDISGNNFLAFLDVWASTGWVTLSGSYVGGGPGSGGAEIHLDGLSFTTV